LVSNGNPDDLREEITMEQIKSKDGTPIGLYRSGSGPPLLLVHGMTADYSRWSTICPRFERDFTVYAMNRRGRGMSGDSPAYTLQREAEDIAAVAEAIGKQVSVLGHSYGGLLCLEAALLTGTISRLILYEPDAPTGNSYIPPDLIARMHALVDQGKFEPALEILFKELVEMPEDELEEFRRLPMWKVRIKLVPTIPRELDALSTYRFEANRFSTLQTPTMLLLGGDSPPLARQAIERIDDALTNSQIVILAGQQHIAMDTAPELFAGQVLGFLGA
jgi:pimeloyl-ACP methyl ester carboxylesterase